MKHPSQLRFSRLRLSVLTFLDLGMMALAALGIQEAPVWLTVPSYILLVFSSCLMLLLCREWFSPSIIEMDRGLVSLKWNNWYLSGRCLRAELTSSRPQILILTVDGTTLALDPVGPLHLAAMYLAKPLLSIFLPPHLAQLYFLDSKKLSNIIALEGGPAVLRFPAWLFGKRRIRYVLEKGMG